MKVSVVIATYNGERFLGEQLTSLMKQKLLPDEVVICDDSPNDLTQKVIEQFLQKLNIQYYHNEKTLGVNNNFTKALSLAKGEFIFLCDQDDYWHEDKIIKMVDELEKNPQLDGVFCNSSVVDSHLQKLNYSLWKMRNFTRKMQTELSNGNSLKVFLKRVTLSAHNIAFRRRALNYIFPIPEITPFYLDTWIGLCIALFSNWAMIDEELTDYRVHENNESSPKMAGIITQVILSKKARSKNSIAATVKLADDLLEISQGKVSNEKLNSLKNFKTHYVVRNNYSHFFVIRVVQVLFELLSFRYKYYSNGWKSIAADIILFK